MSEVTENVNVASADREPSEVERLRDEVRREHEMYLRALADFDNYRRRMERDRETATQAGKRGLVLSLIDAVDTFESGLAHLPDMPSSVKAGIQAIYRKLLTALESHGVTPFKSLGEPFSPELHEAIGYVETTGDGQPGEVVDELQRGYKWDNVLLRPARVRVAQ